MDGPQNAMWVTGQDTALTIPGSRRPKLTVLDVPGYQEEEARCHSVPQEFFTRWPGLPGTNCTIMLVYGPGPGCASVVAR